MAKKQEDNRDVFEKALDYAVPVAAGYLGMKAGSRLMSGGKKGLKKARSSGVREDVVDHYFSRAAGGGAGALYGGAVGAVINARNNKPQDSEKRRK